MEIPYGLKSLYKHWEKHTTKPPAVATLECNTTVLNDIDKFATERMCIWEKKHSGENFPYTKNKILSAYRFCNIYRELDKQTIQIHQALKDYEADLDMWVLNMLFQRMVCNPDTIRATGLLSFSTENNEMVYRKLTTLPRPKYGVAYIFPISLVQKVGLKTREEFFCFYLPKVMKSCASIVQGFKNVSVVEGLNRILPAFGLSFKFHWTETLIDLAYQFPEKIDLFASFPIGPGSLPTMRRLNPQLSPEDMSERLITHEISSFPYLTFNRKRVWLSAENWEGIGCEYRKYCNLLSGTGRRRKYSHSVSDAWLLK